MRIWGIPSPIIIGIIASTLLGVVGCTYIEKEPSSPLETVSHVDLNRYMGVWYEIARYPNSFQKGCVGSRATYTLLDDGKVSVLNECYDGSFSGKLQAAKGKAWVVDKETKSNSRYHFSGSLRVTTGLLILLMIIHMSL